MTHFQINTLEQLRPILTGFRKSNGLSQKALAEKLGISQQSYQALESAPHKATFERLYKVFAALNIKVQLFSGEEACASSGVIDGDEW